MKKLTFGAHYNFVINHPQYRFRQEEKSQYERRYLNRYTKMNGEMRYPAANHCYHEIGADVDKKFGELNLKVYTDFDIWDWREVRGEERCELRHYVSISCYYSSGSVTKIQFKVYINGRLFDNYYLCPNTKEEINRENVINIVRRWCNKNLFLENTKYRRALLIAGGDKEHLKNLLVRAWRPKKTVVDEETILRCIRRKYNITGCMHLEDLARWGREHGRQKTLKKLAKFRLDYVYDYLEGEEDEDSIQDALDAYYQDMEGHILV